MSEVKNPIIRETKSYYAGWVIREYADGTFDAYQPSGVALTIGCESFGAAVAEIRQLRV